MTDEEILTEAIKKAMGNGFEIPFEHSEDFEGNIRSDERVMKWKVTRRLKIQVGSQYTIVADYVDYYRVIFSHAFAKAFWGEEWIEADYYGYEQGKSIKIQTGAVGVGLPAYLYHLQMMIISENPIRYLEQFLD